MKVQKNAVVSVSYTLREGESAGEVIETCTSLTPLEFMYENGSMLPEFEKQLAEMEQGSSFDFSLSPQQAYGESNPEALVTVKKDIFVIDGVLREDLLVVGNILPMRNEAGNAMNGVIKEINNDSNEVVIDFNHPLAGKTLHFSGTVESVREATEDELANGLKRAGGCGSGCGCAEPGDCSEGDCNDDSCGSDCGCK